MEILVVILICLALSFLISEIFYRFKYPPVLGPIFAGIILGLPTFRQVFKGNVITDIEFLSGLGIIFLLFLAGMDINIKKLIKAEYDSIFISVFATAIPFVLGFGAMRIVGYSYTASLILGAALSVSAASTNIKILLDLNALNTKLGTIILGAGIIDDFFELIFLSGLVVIAQKTLERLMWFPIEISAFIFITFLTYKFIPKLIRLIQIEKTRMADFSVLIIFAISIALISTKLSLSPIIGAFVAGIIINIIHHKTKRLKKHYEEVNELKVLTFSLIIPFFFINTGLHFNFATLINNFWFVFMILIIATAGKIIGALVAKPLTDLSWKQAYLVGWGLNSRGGVELVIAEVARMNGLISAEVYSAIIIVAILSTLLFPIVLRNIIEKDRKILY